MRLARIAAGFLNRFRRSLALTPNPLPKGEGDFWGRLQLGLKLPSNSVDSSPIAPTVLVPFPTRLFLPEKDKAFFG